ncbi:hypothetical protein BDZ97DRAFT_2059943 [Flammula alnicola]|nr:hypothetical protein BDZ97DRAFT_2059943 [Flammula alnicola]
MHASYCGILEVIWKDFHFSTGQGTVADTRRAITSKMIGFFAHNRIMTRSMYGERTLKIVVHSWSENRSPFALSNNSAKYGVSHVCSQRFLEE